MEENAIKNWNPLHKFFKFKLEYHVKLYKLRVNSFKTKNQLVENYWILTFFTTNNRKLKQKLK